MTPAHTGPTVSSGTAATGREAQTYLNRDRSSFSLQDAAYSLQLGVNFATRHSCALASTVFSVLVSTCQQHRYCAAAAAASAAALPASAVNCSMCHQSNHPTFSRHMPCLAHATPGMPCRTSWRGLGRQRARWQHMALPVRPAAVPGEPAHVTRRSSAPGRLS